MSHGRVSATCGHPAGEATGSPAHHTGTGLQALVSLSRFLYKPPPDMECTIAAASPPVGIWRIGVLR
ncbi:unnamed protein product [Boreogadus saida]